MKDKLIILLREKGFQYSYTHEIVDGLMKALSADRRKEKEVIADLNDIGDVLKLV